MPRGRRTMAVRIGVLKESRPNERRVALVPAVAERLLKRGCELRMERGAGTASRIPDASYRGVTLTDDALSTVADADVVLTVQPPPLEVAAALKPGSVLISFVYAHKERELTALLRDRRITCF